MASLVEADKCNLWSHSTRQARAGWSSLMRKFTAMERRRRKRRGGYALGRCSGLICHWIIWRSPVNMGTRQVIRPEYSNQSYIVNYCELPGLKNTHFGRVKHCLQWSRLLLLTAEVFWGLKLVPLHPRLMLFLNIPILIKTDLYIYIYNYIYI